MAQSMQEVCGLGTMSPSGGHTHNECHNFVNVDHFICDGSTHCFFLRILFLIILRWLWPCHYLGSPIWGPGLWERRPRVPLHRDLPSSRCPSHIGSMQSALGRCCLPPSSSLGSSGSHHRSHRNRRTKGTVDEHGMFPGWGVVKMWFMYGLGVASMW